MLLKTEKEVPVVTPGASDEEIRLAEWRDFITNF